MAFEIHRGCLLVRQSFFHDDSNNLVDVGGGVCGLRGFHSSFRPTQAGLSLNMGTTCSVFVYYNISQSKIVLISCLMALLFFYLCADVSTTMILKPGPVIDFILANQNVREPRYVDWVKVNYC